MYEKNDGKDVKEFMSIEEIKTELDKNLSLDDLFEKLGITR
jgi:capsule polysaccharide export protein KpsE/RkpR